MLPNAAFVLFHLNLSFFLQETPKSGNFNSVQVLVYLSNLRHSVAKHPALFPFILAHLELVTPNFSDGFCKNQE